MKSFFHIIISLFTLSASVVAIDQYCRDNYNTSIIAGVLDKVMEDRGVKSQFVADNVEPAKKKSGSKSTAKAGNVTKKKPEDSENVRVSASSNSDRTTISFVNGDRYVGQFWNDKMSGTGEYTWANGDRYKGEYLDGKRHGKGVKTWVRGDRYDGEWKCDQITGFGEYVWANGNRYRGDFINGTPNGYGEMTYSDGRQFKGIWKDGQYVEQ